MFSQDEKKYIVFLGVQDIDVIRKSHTGTVLASGVMRQHNLDLDSKHSCGYKE